MVSIERQAGIDKIRDKIDILESDYEESRDESVRAYINELYDLVDMLENSRD